MKYNIWYLSVNGNVYIVCFANLLEKWGVRKVNPLKQGLRPYLTNFPTNVFFFIVRKVNPLKQGLRR